MNKKAVIFLFFIIAAFALGYFMKGAPKEKGVIKEEHAAHAEKKADLWTCAMHPQIKLSKPGRCPICGMDLIPVKKGGGGEGEGLRSLTMSEEAKKLAEVQTSPVERKFVTVDVRMVGKVEYDETRLAYITAWIPGRLDRLFVDYTGVSVKKGDHMVYIYSPDILSTQEELLQALEAVSDLKKSDIGIMKETALGTVEAARERLRLWGLTAEQIENIEKKGKPSDHITINAPIGGIVIGKNALEGMYVEEGSKIYTIADLSRVWIMLDAYESDLEWIRYGQEVELSTEAYPGEAFTGRISFIDPVLNEKTRTVKVRVNADNPDGRLKPGMFVRAVVKSHVATGGRVMDPALAGKWICPMHPEVIEDGPGDCPICGMLLVTTESLGYVSEDEKKAAPLVIPATAPLITGKRAVVYIEVPGAERPTFEGREIVLGPRAGNYYLVRAGLKEGEKVVTHGNFKIDSAIQIEAKPSMMLPEGGGGGGGHHHGGASPAKKAGAKEGKAAMKISPAFREALAPVYRKYFVIQSALADGDREKAAEGYGALEGAVGAVKPDLLEGHPRMLWKDLSRRLANDAVVGRDARTIGEAREALRDLSADIVSMEKKFGHAGEAEHYLFSTPVSFDRKEALWLQNNGEPVNPYSGQGAGGSGEVREKFEGKAGEGETATGEKKLPVEAPPVFGKQLSKLLDVYLSLQQSLANDDSAAASGAAKNMLTALAGVDMKLLKGKAHMEWMKQAGDMEKTIGRIVAAGDIEGRRRGFALLSEIMPAVLKKFNPSGAKPVYRFKCPMVFGGRGATWLQSSPEVRNPYFGKTMITCGKRVEL